MARETDAPLNSARLQLIHFRRECGLRALGKRTKKPLSFSFFILSFSAMLNVDDKSLTYKRAAYAAVDRDRDDRRCRSRDPGRTPTDGPDGARAGTAGNRNGPAIRKPRQLRCACWFRRVWQLSYTRRESLRVFVRASIAPAKGRFATSRMLFDNFRAARDLHIRVGKICPNLYLNTDSWGESRFKAGHRRPIAERVGINFKTISRKARRKLPEIFCSL